MKLGIVGCGKVGSAVKFGFERIGHQVLVHDTLHGTLIKDVLPADAIFICVPTPPRANGACDTSYVDAVVHEIDCQGYEGLVVIKSTVTPGTTDRLRVATKLRLAFSPEFLRERAALSDFVDNQTLCIAGTYTETDAELIRKAHGPLPKNFVRLLPIEAELAKYFANSFNALRVVFANQFYDVCESVGADYTAIKNAIVKRGNIGDFYLECNANTRAYGGSCLPKDTAALAAFIRERKLDVPLFDHIEDINRSIK